MLLSMEKRVFFLLFVTVLAPIVLYTDKLISDEYIEDVSSFTSGGSKIRKLNLYPQASSNSLDNSSKYVSDSSQIGVSGQDFKDITLVVSGAHKTRVLSTTDDGNESETDKHIIKQVVDGSSQDDESDNLSEKEEDESDNLPEKEEENEAGEEEKHKISIAASEKLENEVNQDSARASSWADSGKPVDYNVRHLKDQLIRARVLLALSAIRRNPQMIKEIRLRTKELQRALGEASKDSDLSRSAYEKSKAMEQVLTKGRQIQDDSGAIIKKLRAMLHSSEEQLRAHKKQSVFLNQLTAKTLPKSINCLPLRLSTEYFSLSSSQQRFPRQDKLEDNSLYHYALFSDNILAAAVVVNSTVFHAKDPANHVFHIVTDRLNYEAMRMWFLANPPSTSTIQVQNIEEFTWLNSSFSPVLKHLGSTSLRDYRSNSDSNFKFRYPKYMSILNHLRFYLPEIFPKLNKVLFLDDDVVVQKDLIGLWSLDLKGKVIGAVESCRDGFNRFDRYLNFSNPLISKNFNPHACGLTFGMNIFDLEEWRKQNITEVYHIWQRLNRNRQLWKLGTLPPGLITFWNRTFPLDPSWHVFGLGYDPSVRHKDIERAAVIHYNGNMKPWLEVGITRYKSYWTKFMDYNQAYVHDCNINP